MNPNFKNIFFLIFIVSLFVGCAKDLEILSKNMIRDIDRINNGTYYKPLKKESKVSIKAREEIINKNDLLTEVESKYPRQLNINYFEKSKWAGFTYKYDDNKVNFIELDIGNVQDKSNLEQVTDIRIYDSKDKKKLLVHCDNAKLSLPLKGFFIIDRTGDECKDWNNEIFKIFFKRENLESNIIHGITGDLQNKKGEIILQRKSEYILPPKKIIKTSYSDSEYQNKDYLKSNDSDIFVSLNTDENKSIGDFGMLELDSKSLLVHDGKEIKIWDLDNNKITKKLLVQIAQEQVGSFSSIAISPDKKYLAVAGVFDGPLVKDFASINIFDLKEEKIIKTFKMNKIQSNAKSLSFSEDGKFLFAMTFSGEFYIWDIKTMKYTKSLFFSKNNNLNVTDNFKIEKVKDDYKIYISYQNELKVFSLKSGELIKEFICGSVIIDFDINNNNIVLLQKSKELKEESLYLNKVYILDKNLELNKLLTFKESSAILFSKFTSDDKKLVLASYNRINFYSLFNDYNLIDNYFENKDLNIRKISIENNKLLFYNIANYKVSILDTNTIKKVKDIGNNISSKMAVSINGDTIGFTRFRNELVKNNDMSTIIIEDNFNLTTKKISKNINLNKKSRSENNIILEQIDKNATHLYQKTFLSKKFLGKIYKTYANDNFLFYKDFIIRAAYGEIEILNLNGYKIASLRDQGGFIGDLELDGDKLISSNEFNISVWDLSKIENIVTFKEAKDIEQSTYKILEKNRNVLKINSKTFDLEEHYSKLIDINNFELAYKLLNIKIIKPLINILITNNNDWIMWTPEGYFDSSENGYKYIGFHINQGYDKEAKWVGIEKLYDHFYRPDLVKLALDGTDITPYTKGLSYQDVLRNPAPEIKITKVNNKEIRTDSSTEYKDKVSLDFNINQVDNGGVGLIRVYQEGKLVKTIGEGKINRSSANAVEDLKTEELTQKAKEEQEKYLANLDESSTKSVNGTIEIDDLVEIVNTNESLNNEGLHNINLPLKAGENKIEIEAFNKTNTVASIRETFTINAKIPEIKPTVYAIIAGVNDFEKTGTLNNLKYSENDAKAIENALKEKVKDKVITTMLLGKDFTKENLYKEIEKIKSKARLEDKIVFYVSTHGKAYKGDLFLVPQNNKNAKNWIKFEEMFKEIQSISALDQVFIVDACESGKAKDIVSSIYDSKASVLAKQSGVHILLATAKGTFAFEHPDPKIKHGVFTNNILNALNENKTDKNKDKKISVIELSDVLRSPEYITKHQYPVIRNVGQDTKLRDLN